MGKAGTFPSALVINTFNLHDDSINWLYHLTDRVTELVLAVKNLPASAGDGKRRRCDPWITHDPWKKGIATHCVSLQKPWTEEAW